MFEFTNRGVQYSSREYREQLLKTGARISVLVVGNPYDNAKAESFFKMLKQEEAYLKDYNSFAMQNRKGEFSTRSALLSLCV